MHLIGFTIEIYHDARLYKRQTKTELSICWTHPNPVSATNALWFLAQLIRTTFDACLRHRSGSQKLAFHRQAPISIPGDHVRSVHKLTMEQVFFLSEFLQFDLLISNPPLLNSHVSTLVVCNRPDGSTLSSMIMKLVLSYMAGHVWDAYRLLRPSPQHKQFRSHRNIKQ